MKKILLFFVLCLGFAYATEPQYYLRNLDTPKDTNAINDNFRNVATEIKTSNTNISNINIDVDNLESDVLDLQTDISNLSGYINGLNLENDSGDTQHDIKINIGMARSVDDDYTITLTTNLIKKIDANWVQGTNQGGFPSGLSLSANTWYHFFVISDTQGNEDAGFDTSLTASNLLADATGFTEYRRVGSVKTDGSSNILQFYQEGSYFWWKTPIEDISTTLTTSVITQVISTPFGINTTAIVKTKFIVTGGVTGYSYTYSPYLNNIGANLTIANAAGNTSFTASLPFTINVLTNTSSQVKAVGNTTGGYSLVTFGWIDFRGGHSSGNVFSVPEGNDTEVQFNDNGSFGSDSDFTYDKSSDILSVVNLDIVNTIDEFSTDTTLSDNSDTAVPTEKAVKTYIDSNTIKSINSLTANDQFIITGTSGSDFNIASSVSTHTINLPTASGSVRGALSSADWTTFNNKLDNVSGEDHSTLSNLDYASAAHTGFEKSLIFSTGLTRTADTITTNDSQIVHDNLSGFVLDEHIAHSGVNINAGGILSGGGSIDVSRTITLNHSDVDHDQTTNTHNLTTDIDHDQLTNYLATEHFLQSAITQISSSVANGILTTSGGTLGSTPDNHTNWDTAYGWGDHSVEGYLKNIVEDTTPQLGGLLDSQEFGIDNVGDITHDDVTASDWTLENQDLDKDTVLKVNDGGVSTEVLRLIGADGITQLQKELNLIYDGGNATFRFFSYGGDGRFNARSANGTLSSPTASLSGDKLFRLGAAGHTGVDFVGNRGAIEFEATENYTVSAQGTKICLSTTPNGSTIRQDALEADEDGGIFAFRLLGSTGGSDVRYDTTTKEIFYDTSSERYKENIVNLESASWLYTIPVRQYNRIGYQETEIGVIAEELEQLKPELVSYALFEKISENNYKKLTGYKNISDFHNINPNTETQADLIKETEDENGDISEVTETKTIIKLPESVNKSDFIIPMLKELQILKSRIDTLEAGL
jgi:hypothetical protein